MRRVLLLPLGSSGDVNPFLWIGRQLRERGHEVSVVVNAMFGESVRALGLRHIPFGDEAEFHALLDHPDIWHPTRGQALVMRAMGDLVARHCEVLAHEADRDTLVLAPATAFGAHVMREKIGFPLVTVHLQPCVILSASDTAFFSRGMGWTQNLPVPLKRLLFRLIEAHIGGLVRPGVRAACKTTGVPAPRNAFREWWHSPDGGLCLWPEWFRTAATRLAAPHALHRLPALRPRGPRPALTSTRELPRNRRAARALHRRLGHGAGRKIFPRGAGGVSRHGPARDLRHQISASVAGLTAAGNFFMRTMRRSAFCCCGARASCITAALARRRRRSRRACRSSSSRFRTTNPTMPRACESSVAATGSGPTNSHRNTWRASSMACSTPNPCAPAARKSASVSARKIPPRACSTHSLHGSLFERPEERNEQRDDDEEEQVQGRADTQEVAEFVAARAINKRVRLIADGVAKLADAANMIAIRNGTGW